MEVIDDLCRGCSDGLMKAESWEWSQFRSLGAEGGWEKEMEIEIVSVDSCWKSLTDSEGM